MALPSAAVTAIAILSLVVYALSSTGYPVHQARLHDDGVWVSTNQLNQFGRMNKAVDQFDGWIYGPDHSADQVDLDILQDGSAVAGWDRSAGRLMPIGVEDLTLGTNDKANVDAADLIAMAGGTIAVLDPGSGSLWAARYDPDASLGSLAGLDRSAPKTVGTVGAHAAMTVGPNGVIYTVSAAKGMTMVAPSGGGFSTSSKPVPVDHSGSLSITAVGNVPVVLEQADGGSDATVLVHGTDRVTIHDAAKAVLQQPGPASRSVLLASAGALFQISLEQKPTAHRLATPDGGAGDPAAPVQLRGCVFAAWNGAPGSTAAGCGTSPRVTSLVSASTLIFRVNRQQVVLNDQGPGRVWDLDSGTPAELDDWSKIHPPKDSAEKTPHPDDPGNTPQSKPPIATKDELGARAGRTTPLYVLDNDSDPAGKVLTIAGVSDPSSSALSLVISPDQQTVLLALPPDASGDYTFSYTNSDGGAKPSQPAKVTVRVAPDGSYQAPNLRVGYTDREWATPVNGSVTIPVLADWRNKFDGDPSALTAAKASAGTVITTPQGDLVYSAPDQPGPQQISYTVADGGSDKTTTQTLHLNVQADTARPVPALAQNDFAQGQVGRPLVIYPLDNDLPGSDPASGNATLTLAGAVGQPKNLQVSTDLKRGAVTVLASAPGSYLLNYQAGYGAAPPSRQAQIRLLIHARATGSIIAAPDSVVVHGDAPVLVDVLANDYDPAGNLLDVVQAEADSARAPLQVAVVDGHWLRINATQNLPTSAGSRIRYTVSDGVTSATGQVTVSTFQAVQPDQPITRPDFATVRAGGSTTIPVLDNDIDAGGDPISLVQNLAGSLPPGQLPVTELDGSTSPANGAAYVSGGLVRYLAPAAALGSGPRQVRITYRAEADGIAADGTVTVTIIPPADPKTNPNQTPVPMNLEARVGAGGTVTIPVPTSGVDPDGDMVSVTGLGPVPDGTPAPQRGRLLSYTADSLTYQAYPYLSNGGTDVLTYQVVDPQGAAATATVRIAVVPPDVLPAPVPHPIAVTAAPGEHLRLHVVSPAYVDYPQGDPPTLQDPVALNAGGPASVTLDRTAGWLDIDVPQRTETGTVTVVYGVIGDLGRTASASIIVTVKAGFHPPPIVVDQFARLSAGATTVQVDLLKGDSDPAGGTLAVVAPAAAAGGTLTAAVTAHPQVLPYVVKSSGGAQATGNVYIPAGIDAAPYWNGKSIELAKGSLTVDIGNYAVDPQHKPLRLGVKSQIWPSPSIGLRVSAPSANQLTLTAAPGYNGPAAVSFLVTDGAKLNTPGAQTAIITVPVQVGAKTPVLRCPSNPIEVVQGAPSGTPINIAAQCHVWLPNPDVGPLNYTLSWRNGSVADVSFRNNSQQIPVVVAGHNARAGSRGTITVTATGTSASAQFTVIVIKARPLVVSPIAAVGVHAGSSKQFNVGAYVDSPFGRSSVSVVSVSQLSGGPASAAKSGKQSITISPHSNVSGTLVFRYVMTDVDTGDVSRQVAGQISVQVIDVPAPPTAVTPRPGIRSHEAIITWVAPDAHGSPIDGYTVDYTGPGSHTAGCAASPCTIGGLTNNATYHFRVRAHNAVNYGMYSDWSGPDVPDAPPPPVTGFASSQPLDHQITLSWTADKPDGSPVDHYTITWPGGSSSAPGSATTTIVHTASNDPFTFQISAYNKAGHSVPTSTTGWPTGAPGQPTGLQVGYANDTGSKTRTIRLSWDPDPANGQGPTRYAVTRSGTPVSCLEQPTLTACTDQPPVGQTYTYQVTATNQPGLADPQDHTSPPATITYQVAATPDPMDAPVAHAPAANDPDGYASITFTTSASNGSQSIVHCAYTSDGSAPTTNSASCGSWSGYSTDGGTSDTKSISQLPNGGSIRFAVWEDNASNTGGQSSAGTISGPSDPVVTNGPPSAPSNGSCNRNGSSLDVSWSPATPTGSRSIAGYRISLDGGGTQDIGNRTTWSYGSRPSDGTSHSVQVYAYDQQDQGPGLNITGPNCTDPPPPTITAWDGGLATHQPGTCTGKCHTLNFTVNNFPTGRYTWTCYDPGAYYSSGTFTINITSSTQTFSGNTQDYCENTNADTSIGFGGYQSNATHLGSG
jgi:hypothetical protein